MIEHLKDVPFDANSFKLFLSEKGKAHMNLRYYANIDTITQMLHNGVLRLNDGSHWNDKFDREQFNSEEYDYVQFGKCFSFSRAESVAMWAMYGTEHAKGCLIDYKKQLEKLVNSANSVRLTYIDTNNVVSHEKTLYRPDFEIMLCDILYIAENEDGTYTVKRSDERVEGVPDTVVEQISDLCKSMPWSFENECRLIIRVKKKLIGTSKFNFAELEIPNSVLKQIRKNVVVSPCYHESTPEPLPYTKSRLTGNVSF